MYVLFLGVVALVGGAIALFKGLKNIEQLVRSIGAILIWLTMVVLIITYAEQHDDPWEQYVANISLAIGAAYAGFLAAFKVITERFQSLSKRLDDHVTSDAKVLDQFEKRILERLDRMAEKAPGRK